MALKKGSARKADGHGSLKRPPWPSQGAPKSGAHMLAMCTMPGQVDYFVVLTLQ
jgi:hypothetical protein